MSNLDTIPKDLPITDPLLFSFLVILDSVKFQMKLDGKQEKKGTDLPCFSYAVNSWRIGEEDYRGEKIKMVHQDVLSAVWKNKPDPDKCKIVWSKYPDGASREEAKKRDVPMQHKYEFEQWRNTTFDELDQIISGLVFKGQEREKTGLKRKLMYLKDIFGWEIENNSVRYVYAGDSTPHQFYGVGATFTLKSPYMNCCPKMDETKLTKQYFESIGFTFDNC